MMKRLLCTTTKSDGDGRDKEKPTEESFPQVDRYLVIIGGMENDYSRRQQKVRLREVCAARSAVPRKLKWASTPIIFD